MQKSVFSANFFKTKGNHSTEEIAKEIKEVLDEGSSVRQLGNSRLIQVGNLDGITSKEEVAEAIQNALETGLTIGKIIVRNLLAWPDGTQTANILIRGPEAQKFLKKGRAKFGCLICPVKVKEKLTRCYKFHSFNHHRSECMGSDNSKYC